MKLPVSLLVLVLLGSACKKLVDQRMKTGSLGTSSGNVESATGEGEAPKPPAAMSNPSDPLLGNWGSSCGTLNSPNKDGLELFAQQVYTFMAGDKLLQTVRVYTDSVCSKIASDDVIKSYFSGFDLPPEEVTKQVAAIVGAKEELSYKLGASLESGSLLEVDLKNAAGEVVYTSLRLAQNTLSFAKECLQPMLDRKQCSELSGDSFERRARTFDSSSSFVKLAS